jgi:hypothetical protein
MRKTLTGVALAAASMVCMGVGTASAASTTEVVREANVSRQAEDSLPAKSWVIYTRNAGNALFRTGPATPTLGAGSLEFTTPTGADKVTAFNFDHVGTALSSVDALGYSTYRSAGNDPQVAALNIQVDVNGADPGGFTTLVFEPAYNTGQGTVVSGQWQNWNAFQGGNAIWWSSNAIPGAPNRDTFVPWSTIVTSNPNAVIVGGFGVNQGSGNPALTTAADALTIGHGGNTTTYDFEPDTIPPTSKDQCKNGGWQSFASQGFKNQGDCVSYVSTGGRNGANG